MTPPQPSPAKTGLLARVAGVAIRHRLAVALGWVALLVGVFAISSATGTNYSSGFALPGTDSQKAVDLLEADFPAQAGDQDQIVFKAKGSTLESPAAREEISQVVKRVADVPNVSSVASPLDARAGNALSQSKQIGFATVNFDKDAQTVPIASVERVIAVAEDARSPQLQVELGGQAIQQAEQAELGLETLVGLVAAIVVLLITFGSVLAMGLPILTALLGLGTGVALIGIGTNLVDMPDFTTQLAIMIGLGVGIDYSLFIVTRFRESYRESGDVDRAVVAAMDTAGRAVLFAGSTVIIALLGMYALGVSFLSGLGVGASLAVLMTMLSALTMLPVLLSRFGERIGRPSKHVRRAAKPARPTLWTRWAGLVQRNPWPAAVAGLAIMLALAAPALGMRLGASDAGNGAAELTTKRSYDLLGEGFGKGFNGPLSVVASFKDGAGQASLTEIERGLASPAGVASVDAPVVSPEGGTAVFAVYPESAPQDAATTDLVNDLRDQELPPIAESTGASLLVGGATATNADFSDVLASKLPLFIGIVVALSALLLLVVFRSLVIPIQAAFMNLLSIGASLGIVVAIFQNGWLDGALGLEAGPIDAFIPVLLFAIVFGLSMDYEVFLVSRIHEEWTHRHDASKAVTTGISSTGRVITAAAIIMISVFGSFAIADDRILKLFGISLGSAVFLDAFVVRMLLLPATLELLGHRTWHLPSWLDRLLPHWSVDGTPAETPVKRPQPVDRAPLPDGT